MGELKFDFLNLKYLSNSFLLLLGFCILFAIVLPILFPTRIITYCGYDDIISTEEYTSLITFFALFSFVPSIIYYFYKNSFNLKTFFVILLILVLFNVLLIFLIILFKPLTALESVGIYHRIIIPSCG